MSKPSIAAIIIGIDGWQEYTVPLMDSLYRHENELHCVVIDNASVKPYPEFVSVTGKFEIKRTERLCYSAAINYGMGTFDTHEIDADWYIVLSNDVLCTGPFAHMLEAYGSGDVVGPLMRDELGFPYLEGWCVCVPAAAWQPWDERFLGSDYEDVAYSTAARQRGFGLVEDKGLPFTHLDQRQRYSIVPDFAGKNAHNRELFLHGYAAVRA